MKPIILQIKALLEAAGLVVYYGDVPALPTYPYVLLWSTAGQPGIEASIGADADLSDLIGATTVDTTPINTLGTISQVRAVLDPAVFLAGGMNVCLNRTVSQPVRPDEKYTIADTDRHPAYGVDRYQLIATPADLD